jgi:hypothetical protein
MPRLNGRIPKYRRHRASGQAIVTLNGRDHYLGPHGSETSKAEYDRLVTEWLAHGRRCAAAATPSDATAAVSVNHIIHGFWELAQVHYRKPDGSPPQRWTTSAKPCARSAGCTGTPPPPSLARRR